jgi:hypothetical protein
MKLRRDVKWDRQQRCYQVDFTLEGSSWLPYVIEVVEAEVEIRLTRAYGGSYHSARIFLSNTKEIEQLTQKIIRKIKDMKDEDKKNEKTAFSLCREYVIVD